MNVVGIALDLGSTRFKAGCLHDDGRLGHVFAVPAPPLVGSHLVREGDPRACLAAAETVLAQVRALAPDAPLGLASQRSSFLIWSRKTGKPVTPLISWQDRRAAPWCDAHPGLAAQVREVTGLPLSPHYVGPKVAAMLESRPELGALVAAGDCLLGTLDSWLVWNWSGGEHRTDLGMGARTLLADPRTGQWSGPMLEAFGVPASVLPRMGASSGFSVSLGEKGVLTAAAADQSAAALTGPLDGNSVLVNLGTGIFAIRATGTRFVDTEHFLAAPLIGDAGGILYAVEGTVNGGAAALHKFAGRTSLVADDRLPGVFCLPDTAGVGSPHWRADVPFTLSRPVAGEDARRAVLEGLVFRVVEVIEGLMQGQRPGCVVLSGGLARDPFLAPGLAACLGRDVEVLDEPNATLLGVARLAAGLPPSPSPTSLVSVPVEGRHLPEKYRAWKKWVGELLVAERA